MNRDRRLAVLAAVLAALMSVSSDGPAFAEEAEPARLLLVTVVHGYRHEVIPLMTARLEELGRESGLYVTERADNDEDLLSKTTPAALKSFDGVVFVNTSNEVPVADREAFVEWIEAGGAFVGIHGASTLNTWPELTAVLGAQFDYHKDQATVQVRIDDANHPATVGLPSPLEVHDEIYLYKAFDRTRVHMLLSLDRHPNTGEPGFFPWAWTRVEGKGRVFHTGAGHRDDIVESDWFGTHVLGGIRWALGR